MAFTWRMEWSQRGSRIGRQDWILASAVGFCISGARPCLYHRYFADFCSVPEPASDVFFGSNSCFDTRNEFEFALKDSKVLFPTRSVR